MENTNTLKLPVIHAKRWKSLIYHHREMLVSALAQGLEQLMEQSAQMDVQAASLHIVYLRTSICNQRPYFRLYLLDQNQYNGNTDCWVYWEMPVLIRKIEQTFPIEVRKHAPDRKHETLLEQKRGECAEFLYRVLGQMMPELLDSALAKLPAGISVPAYFGEYMAEQRLLRSPPSESEECM